MHNIFRVKVVYARDKLGKEFGCVAFLEVSVGQDVVEELSA